MLDERADEIRQTLEYTIQAEYGVRTNSITSHPNGTIYIDIETEPKTHISIAMIDGRYKYTVGHNRDTSHILMEMGHGLGDWYSYDEMIRVIRRLYKRNEQISLFGGIR